MNKSSPRYREDWIKTFQPNFDNQKWHDDDVPRPDQMKYHKFFKLHKIYSDFINPAKIVGIEYGYKYNFYNRISWRELLQRLERLDEVIKNKKTRQEIIDHIHSDKDKKVVQKYGDNYFTISGQHRLCLAKYLEIPKVKVKIHEYSLNREIFVREKTIERLHPELIRLQLKNDDNYELDPSSPIITVKLNGEYITIHKNFAKPLLNKIKNLKRNKFLVFKNLRKGLFSDRKIETIEDLDKLDLQILNHLRNIK